MRIDILTLFPTMFSPLKESIIGKALEKGLIDVHITDIRDSAKDKHNTADDTPYGGGPGMVMKADVLCDAVEKIRSNDQKIIFMSPAGAPFDQEKAKELSKLKNIVLVCGHYEGIDQRAVECVVDEEISIGDYILTGGELPAMVIVDAVSRMIPGVLGDETSATEESFSMGLLEYPQYTKPAEFGGKKVPDVLKGGNHKEIAKWRRAEAIKTTFFRRPELLADAQLSADDMRTLENLFIEDVTQ